MKKLMLTPFLWCLVFPCFAFSQRLPITEYRIGMELHDVQLFGHNLEPGLDITSRVLFVSPKILEVLKAPRPTLGFTVNSKGRTSQIYSGLTWNYPLPRHLQMGGFVGGAIHSGRLVTHKDGWHTLGTRCLFRLGIELEYKITKAISIVLEYNHISNSGLGSRNDGLNNLGISIGYHPGTRIDAKGSY